MLTPVDIENKEFTKAFRGYDICEVEEFMKTLVADYEKLYRENGELKEKNAMLNDAIGSYKGMEETMQNAILVAQKTSEDIKQNAYERAETIVKDAERRASEAMNNANHSIATLEKAYLSLQRDMNGFRAKMSTLLSTYMRLLEDGEDEKTEKSFKNVSVPEIPVAKEVVEEIIDEISQEDTNTFTFPSLAGEMKKEEVEPVPAVEPAPVVEPATIGFETERKINPLVEELLQKNKGEQKEETPAAEIPFSVTKETIHKEPTTTVSSINIDDLKSFDVFSDDTF